MHFLGLDLGQAADYSAVGVLDVAPTEYRQAVHYRDAEMNLPAERSETIEGLPLTVRVVHLERAPLGMAYPKIADKVVALQRSLGESYLAVDATGVGRPVVDMLELAGLQPIAITITGGDTASGEGRIWRVPKRDLVGGLQVLLQAGRLKFAAGLSEVPTLISEMMAFQVKISDSAHDSYGSWREGSHDDLILAVAIACWTANQVYGGERTEVMSYGEINHISPY